MGLEIFFRSLNTTYKGSQGQILYVHWTYSDHFMLSYQIWHDNPQWAAWTFFGVYCRIYWDKAPVVTDP